MANKLFTKIPVLKGKRITLRALTMEDKDGLRELTRSAEVYRYLPVFLYERQYDDAEYAVSHMYDKSVLADSLILGVFIGEAFCGLTEIYGYNDRQKKACLGCRLLQRYWGRGIASEVHSLVEAYLLAETEIRTLTASSMTENKASAASLKKNGFACTARSVPEDWGYGTPTLTDKWLKTLR